MSNSHFDAIAEAYDDSLPPHVVEHYLEKRARFIQQHCPIGTALDVGCGTGVLAGRLADAGYEVSGVDPSDGMLAVLEARRPEIRAEQASGTALPFPDDSFDVVFSVAVMHHIAEAEECVRRSPRWFGWLSPAGRVLVWDHNPRNPYWKSLMARVPQDTGDERLIGEPSSGRPPRRGCRDPRLGPGSGWCRTSRPGRAGACRPLPSARSSASRCCGASALTTSFSRRSALSGGGPLDRGRLGRTQCTFKLTIPGTARVRPVCTPVVARWRPPGVRARTRAAHPPRARRAVRRSRARRRA